MLYYEEDNYDAMYDDDMPGGDGILGEVDDGIFESVVIIALVTALVFLVLYRQQRQQQAARQQEEDERRRQQQPQAGGQEQDRNQGVFPPPGDPNLGVWGAGGVGH